MSIYETLVHSPPEVVSFLRELVVERPKPVAERRASPRIPLSVELPITPLNTNHEPIGPTFTAMTRNISAGGVALLYGMPIADKFLMLELVDRQGYRLQLVLEILRCRQIGPHLFEIGGKFVSWCKDAEDVAEGE